MAHDGANAVPISKDFGIQNLSEKDRANVETQEHSRKLGFRAMICYLIIQGYNVALINGVEWQDTKVVTTVVEGSRRARSLTGLSSKATETQNGNNQVELPDTVDTSLSKLGLTLDKPTENGTSNFLSNKVLSANQGHSLQNGETDILTERSYLGILTLAALLKAKSVDRLTVLAFLLHMVDVSDMGLPSNPNDPKVQQSEIPFSSSAASILPFTSPVFDKHLASIQISIAGNRPPRPESARIFQEVTHWHNAKRKLDNKAYKGAVWPRKVSCLAAKPVFMAEMFSYAASLTNSAGKILDPEVITVGKAKKATTKMLEANKENESKAKGNKNPGSKAGSNKKNVGKQAMLSNIAASKAAKEDDVTEKTFKAWETVRKIFDSETHPASRYAKARSYSNDPASSKRKAVEAEVEVEQSFGQKKNQHEEHLFGVASMVWDSLRKLPLASGLTKKIIDLAKQIASSVGLPPVSFPTVEYDRKLSFDPSISLTNIPKLPLASNPKEFQLLHCGPYMDRNLDSAPDPRVPFEPDGWQRKVLDELDADKSIFVVAPTSAGKTFISFYAMERILRADDDSVLVYVAPTKALVNQIAAEIQARFKKTYQYNKSVWAIHTRDYRINNPNGCQVLVTVPHILQIMLLSPSNARSWSPRLKYIIFDEIHSIGQAEDGVVWEQLLLLAPCPIIALSATVGNPEQFNSWLKSTQESIGNELTMITHPHRYSDLRKFIYTPPKKFQFNGLTDRGSFATLGLDGLAGLAFMHPVASLVNKSRGIPNDLSLEARDCLSLWQAMTHHQTKDFPVSPELDPAKAVAQIIRKADIIVWEKNLKELLRKWMDDDASPLTKLSKTLASPWIHPPRSFSPPSNTLLRSDGKRGSSVWKTKLEQWEQWKKNKAKMAAKKNPKAAAKKKAKNDEDDPTSKADQIQDAASSDVDPWVSFNPEDPIDGFHFAAKHKADKADLSTWFHQLRRRDLPSWLLDALSRGIGVHHAGMNRKYRQVVEMLFRGGFLRVVIATGTLALVSTCPAQPCESDAAPYAIKAINSLLSQPRLYLDGSAFRDQVLHHLRFSIEYLRRQSLLSSQGAPINFAGLTSHLYYTENSSFALNALIKEGYFHELCADINEKQSSVLRTLMIVMAHLFGRRPCREADQEYLEVVVKPSSSIVFLPELPPRASKILSRHNKETLETFTAYVETFVNQHITEPDTKLPLTGLSFGDNNSTLNIPSLPTLPTPKVRSAFVALSGHGDSFSSIPDLCRTARGGVFLEEAVIPHLDRADVWFLLNDFSMVLATIVTSLASFLKLPEADVSMDMLAGVGDQSNTLQDDLFAADTVVGSEDDASVASTLAERGATIAEASLNTATTKPVVKKKVKDDWDESDEDEADGGGDDGDGAGAEVGARTVDEMEEGFLKVYKAMTLLQREFNEKFFAMWA
ncbi:alpha-glucosidase [Physcia stellaris]|nr:alpha-glucosidase [Physcia stellaris]